MTMLLRDHHEARYPHVHHHAHSLNYWTTASATSAPSVIELITSSSNPPVTTMIPMAQTLPSSRYQLVVGRQQQPQPQTQQMVADIGNHNQSHNNKIAQALEIARDSPSVDPATSGVLEAALAQTWARIQAQPDAYVMSRDEFAVFNFFQHRFVGDARAAAARARYWDNAVGSDGF